MSRQQSLGLGLTAIAALAIGSTTLTPHPELIEKMSRISPWCLVGCGDFDLLDILLNIILFIPLGLGLRLWLRRPVALAACVVTTVTIELTQHFFIAGRHGGLRDVVTNTAGSIIGVWLATGWTGLVRPTPRAAALLARTAAFAWLAMLALTGFLEQRALPHTIWYGQWAPALGQFDTFPGEVLDAHVDELFLPGGLLVASDTVRGRFAYAATGTHYHNNSARQLLFRGHTFQFGFLKQPILDIESFLARQTLILADGL